MTFTKLISGSLKIIVEKEKNDVQWVMTHWTISTIIFKEPSFSNLSRDYLLRSIKTSKGKNKGIISASEVKNCMNYTLGKLSFFQCEKKDGAYMIVKDFPINTDEFRAFHPSLNATGDTLYFSSDMLEGFGGLDLYYMSYNYEKEIWSSPVNLGAKINTEFDEEYPFYHQASYKLYFSSNGHPDYGMSDIYLVNQPNYPINLGKNINSNQDDFGFILNKSETKGFMRHREKGIGELYEIIIKK